MQRWHVSGTLAGRLSISRHWRKRTHRHHIGIAQPEKKTLNPARQTTSGKKRVTVSAPQLRGGMTARRARLGAFSPDAMQNRVFQRPPEPLRLTWSGSWSGHLNGSNALARSVCVSRICRLSVLYGVCTTTCQRGLCIPPDTGGPRPRRRKKNSGLRHRSTRMNRCLIISYMVCTTRACGYMRVSYGPN